jgi:hypothetical protein
VHAGELSLLAAGRAAQGIDDVGFGHPRAPIC